MQEYLSIGSHFQTSWMEGNFPGEPEGDLCRCGFPSSSRHAGIPSNSQYKETSERTVFSLAKSSWDGCPIVQELSLSALVNTASKKSGPDHSGTDHSCPIDAQSTTGEKHTGNSEWQPIELAMKKGRHISWTHLSWMQNSSHPHQPNKISWVRRFRSWLCKHISKSNNVKTFADLVERMKFHPSDLRVGESVFYWQEDPSKIQQGRKSGRWLQVESIAVKSPMVVISTGVSIFQCKCKAN